MPEKSGGDTQDNNSYTLNKPVERTTGKGTIEKLKFQEPSAKDLDELGYPFRLVDGGMHPISDVLTKYVSSLSGEILPDIRKMSVPDLFAAHMVIMGFFGDIPET